MNSPIDKAVEVLRQAFCRLPRHTFLLDQAGNVRRVPDQSGKWVEFDAAHALFDPEAVDSLLAASDAAAAIRKAAGGREVS